MTETRKKSTQSYQESINGFVEKQRKELEKQKKNDLEDAKYWSRKTNPTIANWITGISKDEIKGAKKSDPLKDDKTESLMDEATLRRESLRLAEVDAKAKKFYLSKDFARKVAKFTPFQIKQIMIYREEQEKKATPSMFKRAVKATIKALTPEPTAEERRRILAEKKAYYNDLRVKYDLPKKC